MIGDAGLHGVRIGAAGSEAGLGDADALFPWWSFGKTVLAICALRLVERGRMSLDDPCGGARLRDVLLHRGGLGDYGGDPAYHEAVAGGGAVWSRARMMASAEGCRRPGSAIGTFAYSNVGYRLVREAVERAAGRDIDQVIADEIAVPLGLGSLVLAQDRADMGRQHWPLGRGYDPRWVFHGLLIGSARDAARLLHALFAGRVLSPRMLAAMCDARHIGGALPGRVWQDHGYGLGVMAGRVAGAGRAIGHSGAGPFSANACYHFPDLDAPCTAVVFGAGHDEAPMERAAVALALGQRGD